MTTTNPPRQRPGPGHATIDGSRVARLMLATNLSHYAIQRHLRNGTKPCNRLIVTAWDKCLAAESSPDLGTTLGLTTTTTEVKP